MKVSLFYLVSVFSFSYNCLVSALEIVINNLPRLKSRRFWRYVFVGGSTFAIDFSLLVLTHELFRLPLVIAASLAYWSSIAYNFAMNRQWTFRVGGSNIQKHALAYATLLVFNYFVNIALIWSITQLGVHYTIAKAVAVGLQIPWTYLAYKKIIFT